MKGRFFYFSILYSLFSLIYCLLLRHEINPTTNIIAHPTASLPFW